MSQTRPTDIEATKYAESYVVKGCKTTAFRKAFPKSKAKPESIHVKANITHSTDKVQLRIKELHASINSNADQEALYTIQDALIQLEEARKKAGSFGQIASMVSAIMGKAKIAGLISDNVNQKHSGEITVRNFADFYQDQ